MHTCMRTLFQPWQPIVSYETRIYVRMRLFVFSAGQDHRSDIHTPASCEDRSRITQAFPATASIRPVFSCSRSSIELRKDQQFLSFFGESFFLYKKGNVLRGARTRSPDFFGSTALQRGEPIVFANSLYPAAPPEPEGSPFHAGHILSGWNSQAQMGRVTDGPYWDHGPSVRSCGRPLDCTNSFLGRKNNEAEPIRGDRNAAVAF
jgi:hypothetical protein